MALTLAPPVGATMEAAVGIATHLCRTAFWHEDRCTWTGDDTVGAGEVCHRSAGPDLYGGTAGIAWFLAHAWAAAGGDGDVLRTAGGAARHALRRWQEADVHGLWTGRLGVAVAALAAARALGDDELRAAALPCCRAAIHAAPSTSFDVTGGVAGEMLGLVALAKVVDPDACLAAAGRRAALIVDGRAWEAPASATVTAPLCGLAHGASGMALALTELARATGETRYDEAIAGALAYERAWFDRRHGGWPDLRRPEEGEVDGGAPPYPWYWCHGSSGIGLARLRAVERTGDPTAAAEAGAAVDHATSACLRSFPVAGGAGYATNVSLCHGVGSVVELHLEAARVSGNDEHLVHARRLAAAAHRQADRPDQLPSGVYGGGESPSLMLGLAGFGAALLRAADPSACPSALMVQDWFDVSPGRAGHSKPR